MNNKDEFSDPFVNKGKVTLLKKFAWLGLVIVLVLASWLFLQNNSNNQNLEGVSGEEVTQTESNPTAPEETAAPSEEPDTATEAEIEAGSEIEARDADSDSDRLAEPNSPEPSASRSGYLKFEGVEGESTR